MVLGSKGGHVDAITALQAGAADFMVRTGGRGWQEGLGDPGSGTGGASLEHDACSFVLLGISHCPPPLPPPHFQTKPLHLDELVARISS